jgi:hypothetical protein
VFDDEDGKTEKHAISDPAVGKPSHGTGPATRSLR